MNKVILTILDGVGERKEENGNALLLANTPNLDKLWKMYPYGLLSASGEDVGLPKGQMGNSEVGHLTIGAGRVIFQPLERINRAINSKEIYNNSNILNVIDHVKNNNSKLHIFGLLSDGGVHSHINHIFSLIDVARKNGIKNLYLHIFLDGRDTLPNVALEYLDKLKIYLLKEKIGKIATISGRYYAMDRDGMWNNVKLAYDAIVNGKGEYNPSYQDIIVKSYNDKVYDEFVIPTILDKDGMISDGDGLIVANFRPDRLRELFGAVTNPNFNEFETIKFNNIKTVTMMPVDDSVICLNAFPHEEVSNNLGEMLNKYGLRVLRIAEYSKFPHVTHFIDGDLDVDYPLTNKVKIPRHDVATYDLDPAMSSYEVTDYIINNMDSYDVIIVNYANGDMVGHTGNLDACIKAMEALDYNIGRLYDSSLKNNFTMMITADHGNCEEMISKDGKILTAHTTNLVRFCVTDKNYLVTNGSLKDVAPTVLSFLGKKVPDEMTGKNLLEEIL